jgi:hypothetical protein
VNIYYLVIAQIFRFGLRAVAAYLAYVGVAGDMQNELVETIVTQVTPAVLLLFAEGWSYFQKKYFPVLLETALEAPPSASVNVVKFAAKNKTRAPVIY